MKRRLSIGVVFLLAEDFDDGVFGASADFQT